MKTAMQELIKEFQDLKKTLLYPSSFKAVDECIDLCYAKLELEKQQIIDACNFGYYEGCAYMSDIKSKYESFEQYYDEKFKNEKL